MDMHSRKDAPMQDAPMQDAPMQDADQPAGEHTAPRDDVHVATNRCPFCHEAVAFEQAGWVSCRRCQARHHGPCWSEARACGACGHDRCLTDGAVDGARPAVGPVGTGKSADLGRWGLGVGAVALFVGVLGTLLSYQSTAPALDVPFGPHVRLGEPGLNALGMTLVAILTVPLALTGAGLGVGGSLRDPRGLGRLAVGLNCLYVVAIVGLTVASW